MRGPSTSAPTSSIYSWRTTTTLMSTSGRPWSTYSPHDSATPHGTYATSISTAARRALSALCYDFSSELGNMDYCHLPCCPSGTEEASIVLGDHEEDYLNNLARYTAALSTTTLVPSLSWPRCVGNLRLPRIEFWSWRHKLLVVIRPMNLKRSPAPQVTTVQEASLQRAWFQHQASL